MLKLTAFSPAASMPGMLDIALSESRDGGASLQVRLRHSLITAISEGRLVGGQKLPATRLLARQMGIARNTVTAVYEDLAAKGYLVSRERLGYFVGTDPETAGPTESAPVRSGIEWCHRLRTNISALRNIEKPANWQTYPFPFVYGQVDPKLFPIGIWRACSRDALGRSAIDYWAADRAVEDDPLLIEQICRHILPPRGIFARPDEVMITLGSQHGIYLLSQLLVRAGDRVLVEDPGYPDARNIFVTADADIRTTPVDKEGIQLDGPFDDADVVLVTPTCHCPTNVTMSAARRERLLELADRHDFVIFEDDYESETLFGSPMPALKSQDADGRVIYLGTLSKVLAPGMRIGYLVAPAPLIAEARTLRRLMHRSAPLNNQRTAAIFLAEGHYLGLVKSLRASLAERWACLAQCLDASLPDFARSTTSGSSAWLCCPADIDGRELLVRAAARGVLIESGDPFVAPHDAGRFIRLGISSIDAGRIGSGIAAIAETVAEMRR